jgi:hypothetical protein
MRTLNSVKRGSLLFLFGFSIWLCSCGVGDIQDVGTNVGEQDIKNAQTGGLIQTGVLREKWDDRLSSALTGTLITPTLFLTSAHGVKRLNNRLQEGLIYVNHQVAEIDVVRSIAYPDFVPAPDGLSSSSFAQYDVALVRLKTPIQLATAYAAPYVEVSASRIKDQAVVFINGMMQDGFDQLSKTGYAIFHSSITLTNMASGDSLYPYQLATLDTILEPGDSGGPLFVEGMGNKEQSDGLGGELARPTLVGLVQGQRVTNNVVYHVSARLDPIEKWITALTQGPILCDQWDNDPSECDAHGNVRGHTVSPGDPDCAYMTCANKCVPRGLASAFFPDCWNDTNIPRHFSDLDESKPCSAWDRDPYGCDWHSLLDPAMFPTDAAMAANLQYRRDQRYSQDCAYVQSVDRCTPRGTSFCEAGMLNDCHL